jgi:hypothetical protein
VPLWTSRVASKLNRRPFLLFLVLYAAIGVAAWLASLVMPDVVRRAVHELTGSRGLGAVAGIARRGLEGSEAAPNEPEILWATASVAMVCAGALSLPLAWLYTITRAKRGYRQSVVHTLILLPVIVAGVAVMVKYSLALAFSLAGIVAAVRFRTTLEDSKDAVFVFVATGIGLASGVELTVALALGIVFNFVTLLLFRSDFGRTPARLEGEMAEERMKRAVSLANRTSQFVARLDREILEEMAPEQLEALADRAWKRRAEAAPAESEAEPEGGKVDSVLVVQTDGSTPAREAVDGVLHALAKRWHFEKGEPLFDGSQELEYSLKLKKSSNPTQLLDALRALKDSGVRDVTLK